MRIAIDLDHTIADGDIILPGAKEALVSLHEDGHYLIIHSCNRVEWIKILLNNNDIPYNEVWEGKGKPVCSAYVDDRGIGFTGDWDLVLEELAHLEERREKIKEIGKYARAATEAGA